MTSPPPLTAVEVLVEDDPGGVLLTRQALAEHPQGAQRFEALWLQSRALWLLSAEANARARATRDQIRRGRSQREILHDSAFARLQARLDTMPVIEQAKGIIMAEQRCGPEEAFDLLRRASQRANVKVHALAAQIVETVATGHNRDTVTPISLAAKRRRPVQLTRSGRVSH